jgi:hypothetical protein
VNQQPDMMTSAAEPDYGIDFPVSLYDRPMLAMSNLLLRGNVDAATRAVFTPDTLTPSEMETFRRRIAGPKPNTVVKTILDVATNPLVILGLIGGYLVWPAAGGAALAEFYQGLRAAEPVTSLVGKWVAGSFTRLRHLPGMHEALADMGREITTFAQRWHDVLADAYGKLPGVGKGGAQGHRMSLKMLGFDQPDSLLQKVWGLSSEPIAPGLQAKMQAASGGAEISAVAKTRNAANGLWDELMKDAPTRKLYEAKAKARGMTLGEFRQNYFPEHITPNELQRALRRNAPAWRFEDPLSRNLLQETGTSIPDPAILRAAESRGEVRQGFTDELLAAVEGKVQAFRGKLASVYGQASRTATPHEMMTTEIGKLLKGRSRGQWLAEEAATRIHGASAGIGGETVEQALDWAARMIEYPATYTLDFDPAWTRYIGRMAPTYGYHTAGHGAKIQGLMTKYRQLGQLNKGGTDAEHYLNDQLLPLMTGQRTAKQVARSVSWGEWKAAQAKWLKTPAATKLIPADARNFLVQQLEDRSSLELEAVGHGINEYLYLSTMGVNLGPASKNVLQNPLTFWNLPGMGPGAWVQGVGETFKRGMAYLGDVMNGKNPSKAFASRFDDFVRIMGPNAGIVERMFGTETPYAQLATGKPTLASRLSAVAMAPFKFTELWANRMPAFYGAKAKGLAWNLGESAAEKMAGTVVDLSHFTGGAMSMPSVALEAWAPWRQFLQFPSRFMDLIGTSMQMGAAGRRDLGTLSRMLATSAGVYTVGKDVLGTDLSQGLMFGALPLPQYSNAPFYPFPFVPPAVQMLGNVVQGIATGAAKPIEDTATLLVPGGLALRRLYRTIGSKRADYANRTPDGRIPVYNDQGGLVGAYTPLQLTLRAVGIMPRDVAAETGAAQWLAKQRDQIRGYRKTWLDAMMENDSVKQEQVQTEFQSRYPELGPLQIKKSDINAVRQRRETTRVNRILRGFPSAYKPLFGSIVQQAELGPFTQNLPATELPAALAGQGL